jgi:hypothetical protein
MVISGEPDPTSASVEDWLTYREHLRTLPAKDEGVSVALAIANTQIRKLQNTESGIVAGRRNTA